MDLSQPFSPQRVQKPLHAHLKRSAILAKDKFLFLLSYIKTLGIHESMDEYDQRKLRIFNQLNFLQLVAGILFPLAGLLSSTKLPARL